MKRDEPITRRDALKHMGAFAVGMAAASPGFAALSSCVRSRRRTILYFTATGNSLHVARELSDPDTELLSIPQLVKSGRYEIEADEIGLVYPIYGHMPPYTVRQFIRKARLKADYRFAVLTYGNRKCSAVEIWDGISRGAGNPFDYIATIVMVDNWLPNFDMNEQRRLEKHIPENLRRIAADIAARRHWHEPVTEQERAAHREFLSRSGIDPEKGFLKRSERSFVITERCIGCGVCTQVCPQGNYALTGRGAAVAGDCDFCFACIQNCPQRAIRFAEGSDDPLLAHGEVNPEARFRNEHIALADIMRANRRF